MSPKEAEAGEENHYKIRCLNEDRYMKIKPVKPKFSASQLVRIRADKGSFGKIDKENFSREIFVVFEVNQSMKQPLYTISTLKGDEILRGQFTNRELVQIKFSRNVHIAKVHKKKGNSVQVSLKHMAPDFKVWIDKTNLTF